MTSSIAAKAVFFDDPLKTFHRLNKTKLRQYLTFLFFFWNFSPVVIYVNLFIDNWQGWGKIETAEDKKRLAIVSQLLMQLAFAELICESFGQGALQMFILSAELGKEDICLFEEEALQYLNESWSSFKNYRAFSLETKDMLASSLIKSLWHTSISFIS